MPVMLNIGKDLPPRCLMKNLWQNKLVQRHSGAMFLLYDSLNLVLISLGSFRHGTRFQGNVFK